MDILSAPWRYKYVSAGDGGEECVFCNLVAAGDDAARYILYRSGLTIVVLNKYPYTSGHLMLAPMRHIGDPCQANPDELREMMELSSAAIGIIRQVYKPHGFNLGMNIGRIAGAGVEHHFHMHVVPRWSGDTSFFSILGDARVLPETLEDAYDKLVVHFKNCF